MSLVSGAASRTARGRPRAERREGRLTPVYGTLVQCGHGAHSYRGDLWHRAAALEQGLAGAFTLTESIDAFVHREGRDLTGYEDGTETPVGARARATAFVSGAGLDGGSFVAVQRWLNDLG